MSLLSSAYEDFILMQKSFTPDGRGGQVVTWTDGSTFKATADFPNSSTSNIADKITERINCTVTTNRATVLAFGDVVKRVSDGIFFRIISDGTFLKTPKGAGLDMRQSKAEVWTLPDYNAAK